jgi:RNA 2',3'-cyclic 3'-phosphodiesterase
MRTFIAIDLDDPIRRALRRVRDRLGPALHDRAVRWVRPESIHLTLKFLGEIDAEAVPRVAEATAGVCATVAPFSFRIGGFGFFPGLRNPRIFWVGIEPAGRSLAVLQEKIEEAMARLGFHREKRVFRPHLTLARIRGKIRGLDGDTLFPRNGAGNEGSGLREQEMPGGRHDVLGEQDVSEIVLFQSELKPSGALYVPLATVPLAGD